VNLVFSGMMGVPLRLGVRCIIYNIIIAQQCSRLSCYVSVLDGVFLFSVYVYAVYAFSLACFFFLTLLAQEEWHVVTLNRKPCILG